MSTMQPLASCLVEAHRHYAAHVLKTTDASLRALEKLDAQRAAAERIADRIGGRTEAGSSVYVHYVRALQAAEAARNVMHYAAKLPVHHELNYDLGAEDDKIDAGIADFNDERRTFQLAVQARIAPRKRRRWAAVVDPDSAQDRGD